MKTREELDREMRQSKPSKKDLRVASQLRRIVAQIPGASLEDLRQVMLDIAQESGMDTPTNVETIRIRLLARIGKNS